MVNALLVNAPMVDALIHALAMIMVLAGVRGLRQSQSRRERGRYRRQLHYAYSSCSFARVLCHHPTKNLAQSDEFERGSANEKRFAISEARVIASLQRIGRRRCA
jgi:hypothetical protein